MSCFEVIEYETMETLYNLKLDKEEDDEHPPKIEGTLTLTLPYLYPKP